VIKSEIRKEILRTRGKRSSEILKINFKYLLKILKKVKISNKIVGGYYPYNYEVDTIPVFEEFQRKNYQISLPKIKKNFQMDFFPWSTKDPLSINKYGIPEPTTDKVIHPCILLVPLVAFDKNLNRIGYGGGYYDRYIKKIRKNKKIVTIGLAFSFQEVKKIPIKKHDIKLDFIITNKKIR
tara:strand:- start:377 stop:919 length:543 start_codon:yes stop_codon:yes gene_type:complete